MLLVERSQRGRRGGRGVGGGGGGVGGWGLGVRVGLLARQLKCRFESGVCIQSHFTLFRREL